MGIQAQAGEVRNFLSVAAIESTYGDLSQAFAASDSFQLFGAPSIEFVEERSDRNDATQGRGYFERVRGRRTTNMTIPTYVLPPGGNTLPDAHALYHAAFGSATVNAGDVTYAIANRPPSLAVSIVSPELQGWHAFGSVVQSMTISMPEGDAPSVSFALQGQTGVYTGASTATGTVDGSGTPVTEVTPESALAGRVLYDVGSRISVGTSTGHRVTAVNNSTGALTITPSITTNQGATPAINPYSPYAESSLAPANVIGLSQGQVNWAGTNDVCIRSAEVTVTNNYTPLNCWGRETPTDMVVGRLRVEGTVTLWSYRPEILRAHIGRARAVADRQQPLTFILGDSSTAGNPIMTLSMPRAELTFPEYDLADEGVNSINVSFLAMAESLTAGNNEITFVSSTST